LPWTVAHPAAKAISFCSVLAAKPWRTLKIADEEIEEMSEGELEEEQEAADEIINLDMEDLELQQMLDN
jgi:hypothetical protein